MTGNDGPLQHLDAARDARGLSWAAKFVLLVLVSFMGPRGIFPSQQTIAAVANLSARTVWSALTELQARGVVRAQRGGRTKTNSYSIDLAALRALSDSHHVRVAPDANRTACESDSQDVRVATRTTCEQKDLREKEPREGTQTLPLVLSPETSEASKGDDAAEVWSHYLAVRKRWRPKARTTALGDKDRREIKARLKAGYTVADLRLAIDGLFASQFHRDGNYLALTYALRDKSLDKFIAEGTREQRARPSATHAPLIPAEEPASSATDHHEAGSVEHDAGALLASKLRAS